LPQLILKPTVSSCDREGRRIREAAALRLAAKKKRAPGDPALLRVLPADTLPDKYQFVKGFLPEFSGPTPFSSAKDRCL
jgi:hypothetical protein